MVSIVIFDTVPFIPRTTWETAAFINPDGTIVTIVHNNGQETTNGRILCGSKQFEFKAWGQSLDNFMWKDPTVTLTSAPEARPRTPRSHGLTVRLDDRLTRTSQGKTLINLSGKTYDPHGTVAGGKNRSGVFLLAPAK